LKAPPPVYTWNGFYIGGGAGFRGAQIDSSVVSETVNTTAVPTAAFCSSMSGGCFTGEPLDQIALRGTFYGGYNWQWSRSVLLGVEGDVGLASRTRTLAGM